MQKQLNVKRKDVYGVTNLYPNCDQSKIFAQLCGTKTLTMSALQLIKKLGYEINVTQDTITI